MVPDPSGRSRRAWAPAVVILLIVALAIVGALVLRARWLSKEPRVARPAAAEPDTRR